MSGEEVFLNNSSYTTFTESKQSPSNFSVDDIWTFTFLPEDLANSTISTSTASNASWNSTPTAEGQDPFAESDALFYFRRIVPAILLLIGVPGNLVSMAVMCRKFFRSNSTGLYILVLLAADNVFLFTNYSFVFWLINCFGPKTFALVHNTVSCKLWVYLSESAGFISSWVLVTLTIERVIVVVAPHRTSVICSRRRAGIIIGSIIVVMLLLNMYIPIAFESIENRNDNVIRPTRSCFLAKPYSGYLWLIVIHYIMPFLVYCFLPACFIIVANIVIIYKMRRRPALSAIKNEASKAREQETRKVTFLLMAASALFILSTVPLTTLVFLENVLKFMRISNPIRNEVYRYIMVVMPLNQAFNFLVYCVSGASFRRELKGMFDDCFKFCKCKIKKKRGILVLPSVRDFRKTRPVSVDQKSGSSYKTESTYL